VQIRIIFIFQQTEVAIVTALDNMTWDAMIKYHYLG
jgi:hypothetical protein